MGNSNRVGDSLRAVTLKENTEVERSGERHVFLCTDGPTFGSQAGGKVTSEHVARYQGDEKFRQQLRSAMTLLSKAANCVMSIEKVCHAPGSGPLKALFTEALAAQEQDMKDARVMLDVLTELQSAADSE